MTKKKIIALVDGDDESTIKANYMISETNGLFVSVNNIEAGNMTKDFTIITSNGADYNPFVKHVHKHLSKDDDDTTPGGFGVTLVKTLSKSYSYEYKNKKSVISLIFK